MLGGVGSHNVPYSCWVPSAHTPWSISGQDTGRGFLRDAKMKHFTQEGNQRKKKREDEGDFTKVPGIINCLAAKLY